MDFEYGQQYRNLYENHWWWRARERYVIDIISSLNLPYPADVLDVGCGDGLFFDALSRYGTPFGIESDITLLSNDKWRDNIYIASLDGDLHIDRQFDLILMLDVLEHLEDDLSALESVVGMLKPGGKFVATVPALMSAWTAHDEVNQHQRRYNRSTFKTLISSAGLSVVFCHYYFVWTYFPKFMLRLKERVLGASTSEAQTHIPSQFVNSCLNRFSYWEHRVFHHIPVPFGTSLIVVGEQS